MQGGLLTSDVHAPGGAQYEVWRDIDMMGCILARCDVHGGAGTYAAALAWGAVAGWARRDDALWAMILLSLFPFTAGRTSPFWPDPDRLWLAFLCSSFAGALAEVSSLQAVFRRTLAALSWKGKFYPAKVLVLPKDYKTKGVTVMYQEDGDPVEQGVLTSSIKVAMVGVGEVPTTL